MYVLHAPKQGITSTPIETRAITKGGEYLPHNSLPQNYSLLQRIDLESPVLPAGLMTDICTKELSLLKNKNTP